MISEFIIKAILKQAKPDDKDLVLGLFINKLADWYSYNDNKVNHVLEMLVNPRSFVELEHVNLEYINDNITKHIYQAEKYNISDITITGIDNIECIVMISYKYVEKINEDRGDITPSTGNVSISFIDYPQVLNKS